MPMSTEHPETGNSHLVSDAKRQASNCAPSSCSGTCADCSEKAHNALSARVEQLDHLLSWGAMTADARPGLSDFWRVATVLDPVWRSGDPIGPLGIVVNQSQQSPFQWGQEGVASAWFAEDDDGPNEDDDGGDNPPSDSSEPPKLEIRLVQEGQEPTEDARVVPPNPEISISMTQDGQYPFEDAQIVISNPPRCCCYPKSVSAKQTRTDDNWFRMGHEFVVTIVLGYDGSGDKCPCELRWFEKVTHPYSLRDGSASDPDPDYMVPADKQFHDLVTKMERLHEDGKLMQPQSLADAAAKKPKQPDWKNLQAWIDEANSPGCPEESTVTISDTPGVNNTHVSRQMIIRICVDPCPDTDCATKPSKCIEIKQKLNAKAPEGQRAKPLRIRTVKG